MDADFVARFNAQTKQRIQLNRDRAARTRRSTSWQIAASGGLAVLGIAMAITSWSVTTAISALFFVWLSIALVVMAWIGRNYTTLPMPDVAIAVRGDSVWLAGDATAAGIVKRGDEVWPLQSTSVALGTQWGWIPSLVFTAPGRKPRWFSVNVLDQPAEEIVAQIEFRREALPR